ncbi:MAG: riboflavin synthase [Bacteroidia bacterium]|nr:riboflavin synthase [Bacteroidia bacterium]
MFSGIVECVGEVTGIRTDSGNVHFTLTAPFAAELKADQSVSHDGVCLTVVSCHEESYTVTAVAETLRRTKLGDWKKGTQVNLERSVKVGDRLDGHIVQGHIDGTGICKEVRTDNGSHIFTFHFDLPHVLIPKGSVSVNGVSLTVVDPGPGVFSVAIIPYTFEHTNFKYLKAGDKVNLEFDVIGKYVQALLKTPL